MTTPAAEHADGVCLACKAQGRGASHCREHRGHSVAENLPTLLTGKHCKLYMKFRANVLALKEQAAIEQAMQADGSDGVAAALDRLMGTETGATQPAAPTASGEPGADSSADDADDYEWNLSP